MLNRLIAALILMMSLQMIVPVAFAENATMERVAYCRNPSLGNACSNIINNPLFPEFAAAGVTPQGRRNMYLSILNQPAKDAVKKVVVISAGQQTDPALIPTNWGDGYPNNLTGQYDNYKDGCKGRKNACLRNLNSRSLTVKLRTTGKLDDSETLFILAHDMRFGYFRDSAEKNRRENAWWNLLTSKFNPENVEMIMLAGQSRGGCMMFRLAQRLRSTPAYKDIPLLLQGYDAVCATTHTSEHMSEELPIDQSSPWVENPLNDSLRSVVVKMDEVFPPDARENLAVLNIHGGGKIWPFNDIRSFTWKAVDTDLGWWKQKWVNWKHNDMGGNTAVIPETVDVGLAHFMEFCARMEKRAQQIAQDNLNRARRYADLPRKRVAQPSFPVDFNGDRLSDVLLRFQDPNQGLQLRARMSNGDGTFSPTIYQSGDNEHASNDPSPLLGFFDEDRKTDIVVFDWTQSTGIQIKTKLSNGDGSFSDFEFDTGEGLAIALHHPFVGDVDGDGLSDIIFLFDHPQDGLQIIVKYSNGDGTYRSTTTDVFEGHLRPTSKPQATIDLARNRTIRFHAADLNGDSKTDLIVHRWHPEHGFSITTHRSNGDGTFTSRHMWPGAWHSYDYFHSFVGDVNRDRKSDLIVFHRFSATGQIIFKTFISDGNGFFNRVITDNHYGEAILDYDAFVADVNGDRRTDIVLRKRDISEGLQFITKLSLGDGTYNDVDFTSGDSPLVDAFPALLGNFNRGRSHDLLLRDRPSIYGLTATTKTGLSNGSFAHTIEQWGEGDNFDALRAISGPTYWNGGGTFPPCRTQTCLDEIKEVSVKEPVKRSSTLNFGPLEKEPNFELSVEALEKELNSNSAPKSGATKAGNSDISNRKRCNPLVDLGSGNFELTCELTVTASGQNQNGYIVLADLFGGQNPNGQPPMGLLPSQMTFTSSDPWNCGSLNSSIEGCVISVADLDAAGGSSTITSTTTFQNPDGFDQAFNCLMSGASKTSPFGSGDKSSQLSNLTLNKSGNPDNPSSQFGDICVVVDIPTQKDNPEKIESVKFDKKCDTPAQGIHNGAQGYIWNCKIEANIEPTPFNGTLTIIEDASNISSGQAEFINASLPCNGIGTDMLSCQLDGNTVMQPQSLSVQLFAEIGTGKEPIDWQNCVSGRAETSAMTLNSGKVCFQTLIKPANDKPTDDVDLPKPEKLAVEKSCTAEPVATMLNGVEGIGWNCDIRVAADPVPFVGNFTLIEDASNITGSPNGGIIAVNPQSNAWNCASNLPASQTSCVISGANFDPSGVETINIDLFAPTGKEPIKWENCAKGMYAQSRGEKQEVSGNCETISWKPEQKQTVFDIEKLCKPAGDRQILGTANSWVQPYSCTITVTTNGVPFTGPIYVQDVFSFGSLSGSQYVGQGTSNDNWDCATPPFAPLGQGNQPYCGILGADFPHALGTSTITFPITVFGVTATEHGASNCGNLYNSKDALAAQSKPDAQSCVTIVEPPVEKEPTLTIAKVCLPTQKATDGSGQWPVSCTVTLSGEHLPTGHQIRITDEFTGAGPNAITNGSFDQSQWVNANCGNSPVANGIGMACDITTDDIINNGGSISFPYTGEITGPGGKPFAGGYPKNCAFASAPSLNLNAPASGKACVEIPLLLSAVLDPNIFTEQDNDDGTTVLNEEVLGVLDPSIFNLPSPDSGGGNAASCSLDTLYVVDVSGSMNYHNRMNQVKAALSGAYAAFEGNGSAASLVKFNHLSQALINPAAVLPSSALSTASQNLQAGGGTNWEAGLSVAAGIVQSASKKPLVLFITDGMPTLVLSAAGNGYTGAPVAQSIAAAQSPLATIRAQGSRVIAVGIGPGVPQNNLTDLLGPNVVTANANTPIDPLSTDVIMIPNVADSLGVFQKIEEAYCPEGQKSVGPSLLAAKNLLQKVPVSDVQYAGDDEPYLQPDQPAEPKPTLLPQLALNKTSTGRCSLNAANRTYECPFNIEIKNQSNDPYLGPLVMVDDFGAGGLGASKMLGDGWQLEQYNQIGILGLHGNLVLAPNQSTNIQQVITVRGQPNGGQFKNCAILGYPDVEADSKWATMLLQQIMNVRGYNIGTVDGKIGPNTRRGLATLRQQLGLPASDKIDARLFEKLGLGKQLAGTQSCAVVPLPAMIDSPKPAPKPSLNCDPKTTVKKGNACLCRFSRMLQTSPTSCGCIRGHELNPLKGCFKPANSTPRPDPRSKPDPKPSLVCDAVSTRQNGNSCVCKIPNGVMVSRTQCACPQGTKLDNYDGCVKITKPKPKPKPKPALVCDPSTSKADGNKCVCLYERMTPISKTACTCPSGMTVEAGIGCIEIGRPQKPKENIGDVRPRKRVAQ